MSSWFRKPSKTVLVGSILIRDDGEEAQDAVSNDDGDVSTPARSARSAWPRKGDEVEILVKNKKGDVVEKKVVLTEDAGVRIKPFMGTREYEQTQRVSQKQRALLNNSGLEITNDAQIAYGDLVYVAVMLTELQSEMFTDLDTNEIPDVPSDDDLDARIKFVLCLPVQVTAYVAGEIVRRIGDPLPGTRPVLATESVSGEA